MKTSMQWHAVADWGGEGRGGEGGALGSTRTSLHVCSYSDLVNEITSLKLLRLLVPGPYR